MEGNKMDDFSEDISPSDAPDDTANPDENQENAPKSHPQHDEWEEEEEITGYPPDWEQWLMYLENFTDEDFI